MRVRVYRMEREPPSRSMEIAELRFGFGQGEYVAGRHIFGRIPDLDLRTHAGTDAPVQGVWPSFCAADLEDTSLGLTGQYRLTIFGPADKAAENLLNHEYPLFACALSRHALFLTAEIMPRDHMFQRTISPRP